MPTIAEISENIYCYLEDIRYSKMAQKQEFYYTFRRSNMKKRLDQRLWFYGNDSNVILSFWSGMDWKNKTPNILFRVIANGRTSISLTSKDSIAKTEFFKKYLVEKLQLKLDGTDRWSKEYEGFDYLHSLAEFIRSDKKIIDDVIETYINTFRFEDSSNALGFINATNFQHWYNNVQHYRKDPPAHYLDFALINFKIDQMQPLFNTGAISIPVNSQFIFLVGDNGCGKSSLLKALAVLLGNRFYNENIVNADGGAWIIEAKIFTYGTPKTVKITDDKPVSKRLRSIPFAAYGPSRLLTNNRPQRSPLNEYGLDRTHALWSIFSPDGLLLDFNRWIEDELRTSKNKLLTADQISLRYENMKQLLINIIPNVYDIREVNFPDTNRKDILYYEESLAGQKQAGGVSFERLSSGIRSLIAFLGDMMVRLFQQQPRLIDPSELEGIVLIDEIDVHLHPKWQKALPGILAENFPRIQFIVSTHSPIPLLGTTERAAIYHLSRNVIAGVKVRSLNYIDVKNLLPNTILSSPIFGMDSLAAPGIDPEEINVDDSLSDTEFFDLLDKKMDQLAAGESRLQRKYFDL
jgi:predicted ATPase